MRGETIARNYAEALFELAEREGALGEYGRGIETVARLLDENPDFRIFMETPRIPVSEKKKVVRSAFGSELPIKLLHFLLLTIDKRRQRLLRDIARAFHELADEKLNRVNVEVTVARATDPDVITKLTESLSSLLGKTVVPHVRIKPEILGGVLVQAGDRVFDGSLRRRLSEMRQQLLSAGLGSLREAE